MGPFWVFFWGHFGVNFKCVLTTNLLRRFRSRDDDKDAVACGRRPPFERCAPSRQRPRRCRDGSAGCRRRCRKRLPAAYGSRAGRRPLRGRARSLTGYEGGCLVAAPTCQAKARSGRGTLVRRGRGGALRPSVRWPRPCPLGAFLAPSLRPSREAPRSRRAASVARPPSVRTRTPRGRLWSARRCYRPQAIASSCGPPDRPRIAISGHDFGCLPTVSAPPDPLQRQSKCRFRAQRVDSTVNIVDYRVNKRAHWRPHFEAT